MRCRVGRDRGFESASRRPLSIPLDWEAPMRYRQETLVFEVKAVCGDVAFVSRNGIVSELRAEAGAVLFLLTPITALEWRGWGT